MVNLWASNNQTRCFLTGELKYFDFLEKILHTGGKESLDLCG